MDDFLTEDILDVEALIKLRPFHVDDYVFVVDSTDQEYYEARIVRIGHGAFVLVQYADGDTGWVGKDTLELNLDKMRPILYDERIKSTR